MAFFKTKAEKEIEQQMARDEQLEKFNEQIKSLENSRREYREPGSNRHSHHWPKDFKSFVSTYSTIAASFGLPNAVDFQNRVQKYCFFLIYARVLCKKYAKKRLFKLIICKFYVLFCIIICIYAKKVVSLHVF